eukprot:10484963-Lingulodinium_polyedra.AAC.1
MTVRGRAVDVVKAAPESDGAEAWRLLTKEWGPRERARFAAVLANILQSQVPDPFSASLAAFERAVK